MDFKCYCGLAVSSSISKKEGKNQGKKFWACPKGYKHETHCEFWILDAHLQPLVEAGIKEFPRCECGATTQRFEGKQKHNLGKYFYWCSARGTKFKGGNGRHIFKLEEDLIDGVEDEDKPRSKGLAKGARFDPVTKTQRQKRARPDEEDGEDEGPPKKKGKEEASE